MFQEVPKILCFICGIHVYVTALAAICKQWLQGIRKQMAGQLRLATHNTLYFDYHIVKTLAEQGNAVFAVH